MTLPNRVRVGPFDYTIEPWKGEAAAADGCRGDFHPELLRIRISDGIKPQLQAETLLHEILHACWSVSGLGERAHEENAVQSLSMVLSDVLRDNPDVMAWIVSNLENGKRT